MEPDYRQVNAAEQAIQTFKNHCIAGLATIDPKFLLQLWCELLVQAEITLNLLCGSRVNPAKSAYEVLKGIFNFNKSPSAPPRIKTLVFEPSKGIPCHWRIVCGLSHKALSLWVVLCSQDACHSHCQHCQAIFYPCGAANPVGGRQNSVGSRESQELHNQKWVLQNGQKAKHAKTVQKFTDFIGNAPALRVKKAPSARVGKPTLSCDATASRVVKKTKKIHMQQTHNNTLMPTTWEDEEEKGQPMDTSPPPNGWSDKWYKLPCQKQQGTKKTEWCTISQCMQPTSCPTAMPTAEAPSMRVPIISQEDSKLAVLTSQPVQQSCCICQLFPSFQHMQGWHSSARRHCNMSWQQDIVRYQH